MVKISNRISQVVVIKTVNILTYPEASVNILFATKFQYFIQMPNIFPDGSAPYGYGNICAVAQMPDDLAST